MNDEKTKNLEIIRNYCKDAIVNKKTDYYPGIKNLEEIRRRDTVDIQARYNPELVHTGTKLSECTEGDFVNGLLKESGCPLCGKQLFLVKYVKTDMGWELTTYYGCPDCCLDFFEYWYYDLNT